MGLLNVIQSTDGIGNQKLHIATGPFMREYDPLHNDEQAMALVKKFRLSVGPGDGADWTVWDNDNSAVEQANNPNLNRAIVECVANLTP